MTSLVEDLPFVERMARIQELSGTLLDVLAAQNPLPVDTALVRAAAIQKVGVSQVKYGLRYAEHHGLIAHYDGALYLP